MQVYQSVKRELDPRQSYKLKAQKMRTDLKPFFSANRSLADLGVTTPQRKATASYDLSQPLKEVAMKRQAKLHHDKAHVTSEGRLVKIFDEIDQGKLVYGSPAQASCLANQRPVDPKFSDKGCSKGSSLAAFRRESGSRIHT